MGTLKSANLAVNPESMFMYRVAEAAIKSVTFGARMSNIEIEKRTVLIEKNSELSH